MTRRARIRAVRLWSGVGLHAFPCRSPPFGGGPYQTPRAAAPGWPSAVRAAAVAAQPEVFGAYLTPRRRRQSAATPCAATCARRTSCASGRCTTTVRAGGAAGRQTNRQCPTRRPQCRATSAAAATTPAWARWARRAARSSASAWRVSKTRQSRLSTSPAPSAHAPLPSVLLLPDERDVHAVHDPGGDAQCVGKPRVWLFSLDVHLTSPCRAVGNSACDDNLICLVAACECFACLVSIVNEVRST